MGHPSEIKKSLRFPQKIIYADLEPNQELGWFTDPDNWYIWLMFPSITAAKKYQNKLWNNEVLRQVVARNLKNVLNAVTKDDRKKLLEIISDIG